MLGYILTQMHTCVERHSLSQEYFIGVEMKSCARRRSRVQAGGGLEETAPSETMNVIPKILSPPHCPVSALRWGESL